MTRKSVVPVLLVAVLVLAVVTMTISMAIQATNSDVATHDSRGDVSWFNVEPDAYPVPAIMASDCDGASCGGSGGG